MKKKKLLEKLNHKNIGDGTDDKVEIDAFTADVKKADKDQRPMTVDEVKQGLAKRRVQQEKHVREQNLPVKQAPCPKTAPSNKQIAAPNAIMDREESDINGLAQAINS